jgi:hypothetical protein
MSAATRDSQSCFRRGASRNQRREGLSPRYPRRTQLEVTIPTESRQLSPQLAAALLSKVRTELTNHQAQIVDTLKQQCPGFAVMRKLVFGFRTILRGGKLAALHRWMERARKTGIHFAGAFCTDIETGPKRSGIGSKQTVEQRAGGRTH